MSLNTIKKSSDFQKIYKNGGKVVTKFFVLHFLKQECCAQTLRIGFTVSKKLGKAVERNYIKRKLKSAAQELLPLYGKAGYSYIITGRVNASDSDFKDLKKDLIFALNKVA